MKTLEELRKVREHALEEMRARESANRCRVAVAMGTCGIAAGAREVLSAIRDELSKRRLSGEVSVTLTGCKGLCEQEPVLDVSKAGQPTVTYGYITPEKARTIVAQHLANDSIVGEWVVAAEEVH